MDIPIGGEQVATARAHSNIALAKYWGKRNVALNIPAVSSLSITLDALHTDTTVAFDTALTADELWLDDRRLPAGRVGAVLDLVRERSGLTSFAKVVSTNNFPTGAGLASSASGFAALVVAASAAAGDPAGQTGAGLRELSILARRGSASAARSLFGGYVELHSGVSEDGSDAYAEQVLAGEEWPMSVVVAITDPGAKAVGSTEGMASTSASSPFYTAWVESAEPEVERLRDAIAVRDFASVGELAEHSCLMLHSLMLTTRPALIYWNPATIAAIHAVRELRAGGTPAYFTIDAGPQLKVLCQPADAASVATVLAGVSGVQETRISELGPAAHVRATL